MNQTESKSSDGLKEFFYELVFAGQHWTPPEVNTSAELEGGRNHLSCGALKSWRRGRGMNLPNTHFSWYSWREKSPLVEWKMNGEHPSWSQHEATTPTVYSAHNWLLQSSTILYSHVITAFMETKPMVTFQVWWFFQCMSCFYFATHQKQHLRWHLSSKDTLWSPGWKQPLQCSWPFSPYWAKPNKHLCICDTEDICCLEEVAARPQHQSKQRSFQKWR